MHFELQCLNNTIYHNNFVSNYIRFPPDVDTVNSWDNGEEGNYWSDYNGTDTDGDGIGNTPYIIDENNQDRYPLMNPVALEFPNEETLSDDSSWRTSLNIALFLTAILIVLTIILGVAIYRRRKRISNIEDCK